MTNVSCEKKLHLAAQKIYIYIYIYVRNSTNQAESFTYIVVPQEK